MNNKFNYGLWLKIILWLIAIHSIIVGVLLICLPISGYHFFGFNVEEKFFPTQGGIFHIVMSIAYIMAAKRLGKDTGLVIFSYIAKFIATAFLVFYYFIFDNILTILFSGIGDLIMGLIILATLHEYKRNQVMK